MDSMVSDCKERLFALSQSKRSFQAHSPAKPEPDQVFPIGQRLLHSWVCIDRPRDLVSTTHHGHKQSHQLLTIGFLISGHVVLSAWFDAKSQIMAPMIVLFGIKTLSSGDGVLLSMRYGSLGRARWRLCSPRPSSAGTSYILQHCPTRGT